jgi:alkylation response protein AidB-like acyl-CoA dehydrogenase
MTTGVADRARVLTATIERGRPEAETKRALTHEVVTACREAGLFSMAAPREVGGIEASPMEIFDALEVVAEADPSVAWYMLNSLPASRAAAWIDEEFWPRIYTPPLGNYGLSAAVGGKFTEGDGVYSLSGTWPLMTGVLDADWAVVFGQLSIGGERPQGRYALIPTSALTVTEIWQDGRVPPVVARSQP